MAEYIERDKIWSALNVACVPYNRATAKAIESIPAADVRPAVKAIWKHVQWVVDEEWQEGGYWISRCSNCLMPYHTETPFCPHCGARMDV